MMTITFLLASIPTYGSLIQATIIIIRLFWRPRVNEDIQENYIEKKILIAKIGGSPISKIRISRIEIVVSFTIEFIIQIQKEQLSIVDEYVGNLETIMIIVGQEFTLQYSKTKPFLSRENDAIEYGELISHAEIE